MVPVHDSNWAAEGLRTPKLHGCGAGLITIIISSSGSSSGSSSSSSGGSSSSPRRSSKTSGT